MTYMKNLIFILTLVFVSLNTSAQFSKAELQVNGLTCSMCSLATQKQLQTLDFIDSIGTDLNQTIYILYFKKGADTDADQIRKKVEDAGFSVGSLTFTIAIETMKVENNAQYVYKDAVYQFMNIESQTLNGNVNFKVIDKGFITDKEYKNYLKAASKYPAYKTGKTLEGKRVYHITLEKDEK